MQAFFKTKNNIFTLLLTMLSFLLAMFTIFFMQRQRCNTQDEEIPARMIKLFLQRADSPELTAVWRVLAFTRAKTGQYGHEVSKYRGQYRERPGWHRNMTGSDRDVTGNDLECTR